jgi:molybdopterin-guanine dinucleotide biosynthesis protein B
VLLLGDRRWALMHELRDAAEPALPYLLERLQDCDLVLVEGFKDGDFPKLEVWRAALGKPPLGAAWPGIVALATDDPIAPGAHPRLVRVGLHDSAAIADLVLRLAQPR